MKGVTDIFISKEKLAVAWFLIACGCLAGTAWYVYRVAATSRGSMLYVPVENSYVTLDRTDKSLDQTEELIDHHARLALETFLNRGPRGPLTKERLGFLFGGEGLEDVRQDLRETLYDFDARDIHQLMEVGRVRVQLYVDDAASFSKEVAFTLAEGQIVRVSQDPESKSTIIQSFQVTAEMKWKRNPSLRDGRRFPYICTSIAYKLTTTSSGEESR
jgi:hypothetical protein